VTYNHLSEATFPQANEENHCFLDFRNSCEDVPKVEVVLFVVGFNKSELEWRLSKASVQNLHLSFNYGFINLTSVRQSDVVEYVDASIDCNTSFASDAASGLSEIIDLVLYEIKLLFAFAIWYHSSHEQQHDQQTPQGAQYRKYYIHK
jgi:hypothetical protein